MKEVLFALLHLIVMAAKLRGPGGVRAVMAENLLLKQQLIVLRRGRQRAPNLRQSDRLLCQVWTYGPRNLMKRGCVVFRIAAARAA